MAALGAFALWACDRNAITNLPDACPADTRPKQEEGN